MKISIPSFMRLPILYFALPGLLSLPVYSQETGSCAESLKNAQSLFDKGQVVQVPSMLEECMKSGFNREESLAAYRLLIQSYLFEDKIEQADSTMLEFLKKNPEYKISPTDHSSFVHLYNNFNVRPVVQIAIHLGTNLPFLTFVDPLSSASEAGNKSYSMNASNLFGSIEAKFAINKMLEVNFEAGYAQFSITSTEDFMDIGETKYTESQKRLELPVSATYNFKNFGKFTLYGRLGAGPSLTLGSTAKTTFTPKDLNGTPHSGTDIDRKDSRISMDFFTQAGAGIKFKTRGGFITAELRSNIGLLDQTVRGGASAEELRWYYYYVDDNFHLNSLNFSVGYTQIFYKPSKRKE
jgi:hypothetical protein